MAFWGAVRGALGAIEGNNNGPATYRGGDPNGLEVQRGEVVEARAMPVPSPSGFDGWPSGWQPPNWNQSGNQSFPDGSQALVDVAWQCLDLNSNVVSAMPVYQTRGSKIIEPQPWMANPDPDVYNSWQEFAKQLFWDYQLGEAFVMAFATDWYGRPLRFRVMPPWLFTVDFFDGKRRYKIGQLDVTDKVLHIRYQGTTVDPRGRGPLEVAGAKLTQIKLLERYVSNLAETGGTPLYWIGVKRRLSPTEGEDILTTWIDSREKHPGQPGILGSDATLNQAQSMNARDMALLEITQFSEARIAGLLGVPPFLVGLAGASGSLTYSNVSDLYDYHDRSSLRPKTRTCFEALSAWALPSGRGCEVNRDDYTRLPFDRRMVAYATAVDKEILTPPEVRQMERYQGPDASDALTGAVDQ